MRRLTFRAMFGVLSLSLPGALAGGGAWIEPIVGGERDRVAPLAISRNGEFVCGWVFNNGDWTPFSWTHDGGLIKISDPDGDQITYGAATAVSDDGIVFGFWWHDGRDWAFSWTSDGGLVDLSDHFGITVGGVMATSSDGQTIAVAMRDANDAYTHVIIRDDDEFITLPAPDGCEVSFVAIVALSADGSTAAGYANDDDCNHPAAARWPDLAEIEFCGLLNGVSWARSISPDGATVVGQGRNDNGGEVAFKWSESSGLIELDPPPGFYESDALSVSDGGARMLGVASARRSGSVSTIRSRSKNCCKIRSSSI